MEKGPEMSRRKFLAGLSSFGAASMVPEPILKGMTGVLAAERSGKDVIGEFIRSEKQRALDDAISAVQANLRKPEVLMALEGRGWNQFGVIARAVEIPILPEHLEGTSYDTKELHERYPVRFNFETDGGRMGNGVFCGDSRSILSAAHVIHGPKREDVRKYPEPNIDVDILKTPSDMQPPSADQIVTLDPTLTNDDIHGHLVSVVGYDPDQEKHKTYPGIAIKVTPGLARSFGYKGENANEEKLLMNSLMVILPPGEAIVKGGHLPASGMSGSPMFVHLNGKYVFAGVLWGVNVLKAGFRSVEVGYAHGVDQVKEVTRMRAEKPFTGAVPRKISDRIP